MLDSISVFSIQLVIEGLIHFFLFLKKWVIDGNKANGKLVGTKEDASDNNPGLN